MPTPAPINPTERHAMTTAPCPVCGTSTRRESCKPLAHRDQYHPARLDELAPVIDYNHDDDALWSCTPDIEQ